jgi:hypothetical protein
MNRPTDKHTHRKTPPMQSKISPRQDGHSLLESLLTLTISSIILLAFVTYMHLLAHTLHTMTKAYREFYGQHIATSLIRKGFSEIDYHQLPLPPRIHRARITFMDGTPLVRQPQLDNLSEAITFLELLPSARLHIKQHIGNDWYACGTRDISLQDIRSVLIIDAQGLSEFLLLDSKKDGLCFALRLSKATASMIATQTTNSGIYIVPIKRIYTLYRSLKSSLYYLSHVGTQVVERQPIVAYMPQLNITLSSLRNFPITRANILFTSSYQALSMQQQVSHSVERISITNWSLN